MKHLLWAIVIGLALSGCGSDSKSASGGGTAQPAAVVVHQMRFYKGGYFPPPNAPNWSHDFTVDFTKTGYPIRGKHPDTLCFKSGSLSTAATQQIFNMVSGLTLFISQGPTTADAEVEWVEFTESTGFKRRIHLMMTEVPAGESYATNGTALASALKSIGDALATACQ